MQRILTVTIVLVLWSPATALAGSARIGELVTDAKYGYSSPALYFTAAPGERNALTVVRDGPAFTLRDAGATVQAGPGCTALDARTVICRASGTQRSLLVVDAGDGDDAVTVPAEPDQFGTASVSGDAGDDTLTGAGSLSGGPGRDVLTGSSSADFLDGGTGDDVLRGGAANDQLDGDGERNVDDRGGDDRIDGGSGDDRVAYSTRRRGVRVDLAAGTATARGGERDRLTGIEGATGGMGADVLLGDGRDNALDGRAGDDRISGRAGNDRLTGSDGTDTLRGGDGNDTLYSKDRHDSLYGGAGNDTLGAPYHGVRPTRRFRCGSGSDTVDGNPQGALLVDCERVRPIGGVFSARPRGDGSVRFGWACDARFLERCTVTASLRRGARRIAAGRGSSSTRATRSFLLRPRPRLQRGEVVQVVAAGRSIVQEGIRLSFAARWRIRL